MKTRKVRILLVDDDEFARAVSCQILKSILDEKDSEILQAINGEEAVALYKNSIQERAPVDIIFMDINMPKKSGTEATKEIRALQKANPKVQCPVIYCISGDDNAYTRYHAENKFDDYIGKPTLPVLLNIMPIKLLNPKYQQERREVEKSKKAAVIISFFRVNGKSTASITHCQKIMPKLKVFTG